MSEIEQDLAELKNLELTKMQYEKPRRHGQPRPLRSLSFRLSIPMIYDIESFPRHLLDVLWQGLKRNHKVLTTYLFRPNDDLGLKVFKKVTKTTKTLISTFVKPHGLNNNWEYRPNGTVVAVGWYRYQTSATHAAEPLCQRRIVWTVPLFRYEKPDSVNQRYQNTATGGTKSPILSIMLW